MPSSTLLNTFLCGPRSRKTKSLNNPDPVPEPNIVKYEKYCERSIKQIQEILEILFVTLFDNKDILVLYQNYYSINLCKKQKQESLKI